MLRIKLIMLLLFFSTIAAYAQQPDLLSFSPPTATKGQRVIIRGSHLTGFTSVTFGGTPARQVTLSTDSTIYAYPDNGSSGFITVTWPNAVDSLPGFTYQPPKVPHLVSFTPTSGTNLTQVIIRGTDLSAGGTVVTFGGTRADPVITSDTLIRAYVGSGSSGNVVVSTWGGSDSLSGFTYFIRPRILSFSPTSGRSGSKVIIRGQGFDAISSVTFGGTPAREYWSIPDSVIEATLGDGSSGYIKVTTIYGVDSVPGFTYIPDSIPRISNFSPRTGGTGTVVTITGRGFIATSSVTFGGTPANGILVTPNEIRATVGNGSTGFVKVNSPFGSDSLSQFTYTGTPTGAPVITSFSPTSGRPLQPVTIRGNHFLGTSEVLFGGEEAIHFTISSDTVLIALSGFGSTGPITVINGLGSTSFGLYTFIQVRTATSAAYAIVNSPATERPSTIHVLNTVGQLIKQVKVPPNSVQTRIDLKPGTYILRWSDGKQSLTDKIIIR